MTATATSTFGGYSDSTVDFGGGPRASLSVRDGFVVSYDNLGNHRWDISVTSGGDDIVYDVRADGLGHLAIVGHIGGDFAVSTCGYTGAGTHPARKGLGHRRPRARLSRRRGLRTGLFRGVIDLCDCGGVVSGVGLDDRFIGVYDAADVHHLRETTFGTVA